MKSNLARLEAVFRDLLEDESITLTTDDNIDSVEKWDSLASVLILTTVATEFNVDIGLEDFPKFGSVRDILELLDRKLG
jgi:acyl carrier protein